MSYLDPTEQDLALSSRSDASLPSRVAAGARLWDLSNRIREALDLLKTDLRREARARRGTGAGVFQIEGTGMTRAVMTFQEPELRIQPGVEPGALRQILGPEIFSEIFEETCSVRVRKDAQTRFLRLTSLQQKAATSVLCEVENKPRTSFQYGGEGITEVKGSE